MIKSCKNCVCRSRRIARSKGGTEKTGENYTQSTNTFGTREKDIIWYKELSQIRANTVAKAFHRGLKRSSHAENSEELQKTTDTRLVKVKTAR